MAQHRWAASGGAPLRGLARLGWLWVLLALGCAADAARFAYEPPSFLEGEPTTLWMTNHAPRQVRAVLYQDASRCSGMQATANARGVVSYQLDPGESRKILIRRGELFTFTITDSTRAAPRLGSVEVRRCGGTFTIRPGAATVWVDYLASDDERGGVKMCGMPIEDDATGHRAPTNPGIIAHREPTTPFFLSGSWCEPLLEFDARRMGLPQG